LNEVWLHVTHQLGEAAHFQAGKGMRVKSIKLVLTVRYIGTRKRRWVACARRSNAKTALSQGNQEWNAEMVIFASDAEQMRLHAASLGRGRCQKDQPQAAK
jgi:hypothetical protein